MSFGISPPQSSLIFHKYLKQIGEHSHFSREKAAVGLAALIVAIVSLQ